MVSTRIGVPSELSRELIDSAPDGILLIDASGSVRLANKEAEELLGYSEQDIIGRNVDEFVPVAARSRHPDLRRAFLAHPKKRPMASGLNLEAQRRNGTLVPVEISLSPIESGDETLVLAILRDVSQRRAAQETIRTLSENLAARVSHLEFLNAELESFSYSVSHDLRAPLRAIDGFSLALLEDCGDDLSDEGKHHLERVRTAAQRMAQLIDDLLVLSRIGRADLEVTAVDVSDVAASVVRDLVAVDPEREAHITIDPGLSLQADPRLLRLVLENLLSNAWKFTSQNESTHIQVRAAVLDGEPAVAVVDNGAGFDEQYSDRMFGAFQRLHSGPEFPGTGVGLAIVQRIITRHDGRICATSQPGAGATFIFRVTPATVIGGCDG